MNISQLSTTKLTNLHVELYIMHTMELMNYIIMHVHVHVCSIYSTPNIMFLHLNLTSGFFKVLSRQERRW